jgi:hypothetical protein
MVLITLVIYLLFFTGNDPEKQKVIHDTIIVHDTVIITKEVVADQPEKKKMVSDTGKAKKAEKNPYKDANLSYKIIDSENGTFGYQVYLEGHLFIHQPSVPGLPGNEGFKSREKTALVAELVIKKIRRNEMPPSVTMEELDALKALK